MQPYLTRILFVSLDLNIHLKLPSFHRCFSLFRHHIFPTCLLSSTTVTQHCDGWGLSWNPAGKRTGDRAGYSGCDGNVSPTRRAEDEWSAEYQILSKKAHTKGLFFSRRRESAVRSYQTPSSRVDGGPFSCLIYSDKSFRGNEL